MWLNVLWRRWHGRMRPFPRSLRQRQTNRQRLREQPRLEVLEDRMLLSAPPTVLLGGTGNLNTPATSEGGQVSGTYFLGSTFNTGNQSVGGIASSPVGQFGAQLNLNLSGKVGLDLGYSASSGGQVSASYQGVSLQQNYVEPTQFNQQVDFTPDNTNVAYGNGKFSTTGPSVSASAALDASIGGNVGGTFAFFNSYSGSTNFNASINQPLFGIGIGSSGSNNGNGLGLTNLSFLGQNFADALNQQIQDISLSADVNPLGAEIPLVVSGSLNGSSNPAGLHESLSMGVGEGEGDEAVGGLLQLGSMDQYVPNITLDSSDLQSGGVLTATGQGTIADLNLQMGPVVGQLLGELGLGFVSLADSDTLSVGPASVTITPVSFQMGPNLTLAQTGTITPTSQLTYNFSSPVVVSLNGAVQNNGNPVSSINFTPGKDTLGVEFTGAPITVTPTWNFAENYVQELDLDVNLQGTLTAGELSAAFGPISTPTLGPLYQNTYNLANYKIATLYNNTSTLATETQALPSFVIGSSFNSSLNVTQFSDSNAPGSLRGAVLTANSMNSTSPQIIHLGPGTYTLSLPPNGGAAGSSGALYVTAPNLIIEGAGAGQTIINASGLGDRAFNVASGANLTLQGVTIENGSAGQTQNGGGILNAGTVTLDNSELTGDSASVGGAIENHGTLTVSNSTLSGNTSIHAGAGIDNAVGATLNVVSSTIANNSAGGYGGGINNGGTLSVTDSTISGNEGEFQGGGGIFNSEFGTGTIRNSTIANNVAMPSLGIAAGGGGLYNSGILTVENSTISGNEAAFNALIPQGAVGGGIYTASPSFRPNMVTTLIDDIVAGNTQATSVFTTVPDDLDGTVSGSSANNLIGEGNGVSGIANGSNGNLVGTQSAPIDPHLAPLGNYGGPTQTMALLSGSPALDAGTSTVPGGIPLTDQRGDTRTINGQVDMGAVEYQYDLGVTGSVAAGGSPGTVQYSYAVTNNGPDPVAGAKLSVPLPLGTTFQALTLPPGWIESDPGTGNNGTVTFTDTNSLSSGQSASFTITAQLQNTTAGAYLPNVATVGPTNWDNASSNNSVTLTVANQQEGQAFKNALLYHFTDANPNATANDFTASINWGDGNSAASDDGSGTVSVIANPNGGFDVIGTHAYDEEGNDALAVSVSGMDGSTYTANAQQLMVVADAPLTAGALTPPPHATINQAISNVVLFHFTDADPNGSASDYAATVNWGDGTTNNTSDGSGTVSVVANAAGGFDVVGAHTYAQIVNAGTFSVQVSDAGGASTSANVANFQVQAPDAPLTAGTLSVPSITTEGQSIGNQVLFHFSDADSSAQASDYLANVSWGDGTFNNSADGSGSVSVVANAGGGFDVVGSHVFSEASGKFFSVKVTDRGDPRSTQPDLGGQFTGATAATAFTISDPAVVVTAGPTFKTIVNTPSSVQTVATFTDPGGPDATDPNSAIAPYIATIQWGDGTATVTSLTAQANYVNATVNGQGQITGKLVAAQNVGGIVLGSDGQTFSVNLAHQYATQGNYTITVLVNHDGILSPSVTTSALVSGVDQLTATGGSALSGTFGTALNGATVATFTDTNTVSTAADFTATITWGDGQSSTGTVSGGNGNFTVTGNHNYGSAGSFPIDITIGNVGGTATATANTSATIQPATPTLSVSDTGGTYNGSSFPATATALGIDGKTAVVGSFSYAYYTGSSATGTPLTGAPVNAGTYTVVATFTSTDNNYASGGTAQTTFTISPATLTATGVNVKAIAGAPFSGNVASFTSSAPMGSSNSFTATITWGDGSTSSGVISGSGSNFTVTGSHTYAAAGNYKVQVTIRQVSGNMSSVTVNDPSTVSNLGKNVQKDQTEDAYFWYGKKGQALIDSFNGGSTSTALSTWLATTFPSLFGTSGGSNNLTGKTNAQVAAFYQSQFSHSLPNLEAEVLATSLNVYATTSSLGGTAGQSYGFDVSANGLGADSYNVAFVGAAFGVRNFTTLNVYQLLLAVNAQSVNGVLYNGNKGLQIEAYVLLGLLNLH